jgi:hypothetical protein
MILVGIPFQQGALEALAEPGDFHNRRVFRISVPVGARLFLPVVAYAAALFAAPIDNFDVFWPN